jgi:3-dehydroquinate synthase
VLENVDRLAAALDEAARHRGGRQRVPVPGPRLGRPVFLDDISRDELIRALAGLHEFAG